MVLYTIALVIHILISVALVLVILAQTSKGGLDANLGGAAMNVFGGSGASKFLRKWTQILGVVFVASCLFLALQVSKGPTQAKQKTFDQKFGDTPAAKPAAAPKAGQQAPAKSETPAAAKPAQESPAKTNPGE